MAPIFLHCVDSRLEENSTWYGRLHLGPFPRHVALTLATALRRTLLQDLPSPQIRAIELPNALHEYSRLHGVHEPVLDLLLQFRKVRLVRVPSSPQDTTRIASTIQDQRVIPRNQREAGPNETQGGPWLATFCVRGPGVLQAKDLQLPPGFRCIHPELVLAHLAPGALLEGRALITLEDGTTSSSLPGAPYEILSVSRNSIPGSTLGSPKPTNWLAVGGSVGPIQRVSFRIEDAGPFDAKQQNTELVIFEIATNGSISPLQALRQAAERLVRLFAGLLRLSIGVPELLSSINPAAIPRISTPKRRHEEETNPRSLLQQSLQGYRRFADPLGLDLGNLDLSLESYQYWRQQGIQTVGELLRELQQPSVLSTRRPPLENEMKEQRKKALIQLGIRLRLSLFFSLWN